jgi:hypothetical protein
MNIAILNIMGHQRKNLPDTMLQCIAAWLDDEDRNVQRAAVEALGCQANLTDKLLQCIAARLGDVSGIIQEAAVYTLIVQGTLPLNILGTYVERLFSALLKRSFKEHLYRYALDRSFIRVSTRHAPFSCKQED